MATTQVKESGKINLNTASAGELTALKGIGEKKGTGHHRPQGEAGQVHLRRSTGGRQWHRTCHAGSKPGHDYRPQPV